MSYQLTLEYLYSQLPMFHRTGPAAYKANLDNTIAICNLLHNPQRSFPSVHIAGTNGKGSTSHMLAAVLQEAGYKTGLYTSPHLKDFRERIRINGRMIPESAVTRFVDRYRHDFDRIQPSFFEMTVGLCFDYFQEEQVDIAVIETGLGGRLDSTNIITPILSVITNIGYDHTSLLGNTLEKIATEKAGIIKQGIPVVIGETHPETERVFREAASRMGSPVTFADQQLTTGVLSYTDCLQLDVFRDNEVAYRALELDLCGSYQARNILTVLQSIEELKKTGLKLPENQIRKALRSVQELTGLAGRWQTLSTRPLTICDTGHNVDGIREVLLNIARTPHRTLHFVLGMVNDKDIHGILSLLPREAVYYFCRADIPRALPAGELMEKAREHSLQGKSYATVAEAITAAKEAASEDDLVFIGGSTFVVAEAL
jgi:dihydrofolate synthase / folylpolyglutamate synthase